MRMPQAVLLENALVIQLWFYREHDYFKGFTIFAATAVAYKCGGLGGVCCCRGRGACGIPSSV